MAQAGIGSLHGRSVIKHPGAELVAVSDAKEENAKKLIKELNISAEYHRDYQALLNRDDVDAVVIASPNGMHREHAIAAACARKHIYLEKPMANTLDDCRADRKAVQKAKIKCDMGFQSRHSPLFQYGKDLLDAGKLGRLVMVESDYIHHIPGNLAIWEWLGKKDIAGHPINAGTCHNIDLLRFYCGEVAEVACFKDVRMPRKVQMETEDIAVMIWRFRNGTLGRTCLFLGPIIAFTFTLRLFGTRGTLDNNRVWLDTTPSFAEPGHEKDYIELPRLWIPDNVQGNVAWR